MIQSLIRPPPDLDIPIVTNLAMGKILYDLIVVHIPRARRSCQFTLDNRKIDLREAITILRQGRWHRLDADAAGRDGNRVVRSGSIFS